MRVLVEQTDQVVRDALGKLGLLWDGVGSHQGKVGVHQLMGGADPGGEWDLFPEECAVLIGTQDMLLSRALNRGYAAGRARWPREFGLINHDALWVMDEVQLMDVGLATSAQVQAYSDGDEFKGIRRRSTWWMSATLQPEWLRSVDTEACFDRWTVGPTTVAASELAQGLGLIQKTVALEEAPEGGGQALAEMVRDGHMRLADEGYGRISLVVCNTVDRACGVFDALRRMFPTQQIELVHSRFRPAERTRWATSFLSRAACAPGADRIIVATQVVEAGVDISAGCVVTELAPWPSLVQRFGRCARYGGTGAVLVVDPGADERAARPYTADELISARWALGEILRTSGDVGLSPLELFERGLDGTQRQKLYPYQPKHLLLRREFDELFDTTPDLTGADIDISRFIRTGDEKDLQVFWHEVPKPTKGAPYPSPSGEYRPRRDELCAIPFLRARDWLCGKETSTGRKPRLRTGVRVWIWDWTDGVWVVAERSALTPGRVVCVSADAGGYRNERGFDPDFDGVVELVPAATIAEGVQKALVSDASEGVDALSESSWKTIGFHGGEVAAEVAEIAAALKLPDSLRRILVLAAQWHDIGKSHTAFQGAIRRHRLSSRQDLAKAPQDSWLRPPGNYQTADGTDRRPGFRHEFASALSLFAVLQQHCPNHAALLGPWADVLTLLGHAEPEPTASADPIALERAVLECSADEFDLLVYLVAAHHGKVRVGLHATPHDQDYRAGADGRGLPIRGIREGDVLPAIGVDASSQETLGPLKLTLEPASLGLSFRTGRSWAERAIGLRDRFGPSALAWFEAILVAADRRASRSATPDPVLAMQESRR